MKPKILFVEDTKQTAKLIKRRLESWGYKVITVTNQRGAEIRIANTDFSAVITDLEIYEDSSENGVPHVDFGFDLIKYIKKNRPDLPLIVFTVHSLSLENELGDLGVILIIQKGYPNAIENLKEMLENVIKKPDRPHKKSNSPNKIAPDSDDTAPDLDSLPKELSGYKDDIKERLEKFPYSKNVFIMTKYRQSNEKLRKFIISILSKHALNGVLANDPKWSITGNTSNPFAVLRCCKYGIAIFDEPEKNQAINPNVVPELVLMKNQHKNCLILAHKKAVPHLPVDINDLIYYPYDSQLDVEDIIEEWVKNLQ